MPPSGHPQSYYVATANAMPEHPTLRGALAADVCVIGGGFTGVSAALHLAERNFDVVLVEAGRIGAGASGRSGGQVHSGQRQGVLALESAYGEARARLLWQLAEEAKATVKERTLRHAIACDRRPGLLHLAHRQRLFRALVADAEHLARRYSVSDIEVFDAARLPAITGARGYVGGVLDAHRGGHLDPLALTRGLAAAAEAAGEFLGVAEAVEGADVVGEGPGVVGRGVGHRSVAPFHRPRSAGSRCGTVSGDRATTGAGI